jgi:CubicO group peptidase (beta-lactamase class C family)
VTPNFTHAESIIQQAVPAVAPAAQLEVWWRGAVVHSRAYGWLDPEQRQHPTQPDTWFDLASVTKLFVTATFMRLVETGQVTLDTRLSHILPEFTGQRPIRPYEDPLQTGALVSVAEGGMVEAASVTFRQLLAHTAGLPAWRPLFQQESAEAARAMALNTFFSYPPTTRVVYSDIGLILLGLAVEPLTGAALDEAVTEWVCEPLNLRHTRYFPLASPRPVANVAPTEVCRWRQRRLIGEVHDENAARLGGVSGHAGLFSTAMEVARFGQSCLEASLLRCETLAEMRREQAREGATRRGLGFALWSPDPEASGNPFSQSAFGHTGFTGTSVWIDPERALVVALLTNDVYHGREGRGIAPLRVALHRAIVAAVDDAA